MAKTSLTQRNLQEIFDAFEHFFPSGETVYVSDKPFKSLFGEYNWKDRGDFIDFVRRSTGVVIKNERDIEHIKKAEFEFSKKVTPTNKENVESNTPDKWTRESQETERRIREEAIKKSKQKAEEETRSSIERKKELIAKEQEKQKTRESFQKRIEQQKEITNKLEGKRVYAKVVSPNIEEANENTNSFIKEARNFPDSFRQELSNNLKVKIANSDLGKGLSSEEVELLADKIALDAIEAINDPQKQADLVVQTAILKKLANNNELINGVSVDKNIQYFLASAPGEIAYNNNSSEASRVVLSSVDKNLSESVFGPDPESITVYFSTQPLSGQTHEIDLRELSSGYSDLLSSQSQILQDVGNMGKSEVRSYLLGRARDFLDTRIAQLPANNILSRIYKSSIGQKILDAVGLSKYTRFANGLLGKIISKIPRLASFLESLGISTIAPAINIGASLAGQTSVNFITTGIKSLLSGGPRTSLNVLLGRAIARGAAKLFSKWGMAAAAAKMASLAAIGAGIGTVLFNVVGFLIGALVGWIVEKILPRIKRFLKTYGFGIVAVLLLGAGLFFRQPMLVIVAVPTFVFSNIGKIILAALIIHFSKPLIITLCLIPIIIASYIFIINSGAYIVPPTESTFSSNPYIEVTKVASPEGPFKNNDLPIEITYTITIKAKKTNLTNVTVSDSCEIISEAGNKKCPVPELEIEKTVSPSKDQIITYKETYSGDEYKDSFVINTVTVNADIPDGGREEVLNTASIKIGDPPEDCPNNAWPLAGDAGLDSITQGPLAPGCSHRSLKNAIDIGVSGETAIAVHSGIVTTGTDSCVGKYVKITSFCGSTSFSTLYGHLGAVAVTNGQHISLGQTLGITDNTGSCTTGDHLHFEFQSTGAVPTVQKPYLKRNVPIACCSRLSCNP